MKCAFCERTEKEVTSMVAGPNKVAICDQCVNFFLQQREELLTGLSDNLVCSFCGESHIYPAGVGINRQTVICKSCLDISRMTIKSSQH